MDSIVGGVYAGDAEAEYLLGKCFCNGEMEITQNLQQAIYFLKLAADKKHTKACRDLGLLFLLGEGCRKNIEHAICYLDIASENGDSFVNMLLTLIFFFGECVEKDLDRSERYFNLLNDENFGSILSCPYNIVRLKNYLRIYAGKGHLFAQYLLWNIIFHYKDSGISESDLKEAIDNLALAADQGDDDSQFELGKLIDNGECGLKQNSAKAIHYFRLSADQQNIEACRILGLILWKGEQCEKDIKGAMRYLNIAADNDDNEALLILGYIFYKGEEGIEKDLVKARKFFESSARKGNDKALYNLGFMINKGEGGEQNIKQAEALLKCYNNEYDLPPIFTQLFISGLSRRSGDSPTIVASRPSPGK